MKKDSSTIRGLPVTDTAKGDKEPIRFFDNPLNEDFLHLDTLAQFLRRSERWVMTRAVEGRLHAYPIAKGLYLFYVPEVRAAILAGLLAPNTQEIPNDKKTKKQGRENPVPSQRKSQRLPNLSDLRDFG